MNSLISAFFESSAKQNKIHADALKSTGFWGKQGAGALIFCTGTGRFLLAKRGKKVQQPGTWSYPGGAIDENEDPKVACIRELEEETGFKKQFIKEITLLNMFVDHKSDFKYFTYLILVDNEFRITIDKETEKAGWYSPPKFPHPIHFGLQHILDDPIAKEKLVELYLNFVDRKYQTKDKSTKSKN